MYISIDFGGTVTRAASSEDLQKIFKLKKFSTNFTLNTQISKINSAINIVANNKVVEFIALGVPGIVDINNKKFGNIVNYPKLNGLQFSEIFATKESFSNLLVYNDSALAGLGEAVFGAGIGFKSVAYITLSTGVGGVLINNRKLSNNQNIFEPGHQIIVDRGRHFNACGQDGCLSAYVSKTAFKDIYHIEPRHCTDESVWKEYSHFLSLGVINVISMWSPDIIIFGGSISMSFNKFKNFLLEELLKQTLFTVPKIAQSALGDNSGILGGFAAISQYFQSKRL